MIRRDWKEVPVVMMDFEGSPASGVVEYGLVILFAGKIERAETALCRPHGLISERDREVHGLSDLETRGHKPFSSLYEPFVDLRRRGLFAAHNRHAENTFVKSTWALPPAVPDWRKGNALAQEWGPWIDTLTLYRTLYPGLNSYALGDLVELFGCGEALAEQALRHCPDGRRRPHCALFDALASALLLLRLEQEGSLRGRITTAWLLQLSGELELQGELF